MAKIHKYGIVDLKREFPSDEVCAEFIFDTLHSRKCSCGGVYKPLKSRRQFQCSKCRFQIAPTAGTIFHKSCTPLSLWFYAIFLFSNAKSGISAKQLERDLNITYKTAWRMLSLIRKSLVQDTDKIGGEVEIDSAYFGGRKSGGKNNKDLSRAIREKSVVMAAVSRGGKMKAKVVSDGSAKTHMDFIQEHIEKGSNLLTDKNRSYRGAQTDYGRFSVNHKKREFVRGGVHINKVETFWAHMKRSVKGTHKIISKKYLPSYLDGFVWHYNNRHNDRERFSSLLGALLRGGE